LVRYKQVASSSKMDNEEVRSLSWFDTLFPSFGWSWSPCFSRNIRYAEASIPDAPPSKVTRVILSFQLKREATGFSFQGKQNHNQKKVKFKTNNEKSSGCEKLTVLWPLGEGQPFWKENEVELTASWANGYWKSERAVNIVFYSVFFRNILK